MVREYTFCHSKRQYTGVPIMAANMDTVGTFKVAHELSKNGLFTAIDKHFSLEEWIEFAKNHPDVVPVNIFIFKFLNIQNRFHHFLFIKSRM